MATVEETQLLNELQIIINERRRKPTAEEYAEAKALIEAARLALA